jgi:hypothetical protein
MIKKTLIIDDKPEIFEAETEKECHEKFVMRLQELKKDHDSLYDITEVRSAAGQKGYLLFNPLTKTHFFRVYDKGAYTDYDLCASDIEIQIVDKHVNLCQGIKNKIDYKRL